MVIQIFLVMIKVGSQVFLALSPDGKSIDSNTIYKNYSKAKTDLHRWVEQWSYGYLLQNEETENQIVYIPKGKIITHCVIANHRLNTKDMRSIDNGSIMLK